MSNTIITNYGDIGSGKTKPGKQVVVFVNKNGTMSLEKNIIQKIIDENDYENSSVSVVHFDDTKQSNAAVRGDSTPRLNLTVDAFYDPDTVEPYDEDLPEEEMEINEFSLVAFRNDHCYTPYRASDQAKTENVSRPPISNAKKITVLEDTVIPKGKKIIQLNAGDGKMTLKPDILKRSGITTHATVNLSHLITKTERTHIISPAKSGETANPQKVYIHQNVAPDQTKLLQPIDKNLKKLINRKLELKKSGTTESQHSGESANLPKHNENVTLSRNEKEAERRRLKRTILKSEEVRLSDTAKNSTVLLNTKLSETDTNKNKSYVKKDKKPSGTLLSDMTSLFSTPDVIRRVSDDKPIFKATDKTLSEIPNHSLSIHDVFDKNLDPRIIKSLKPEAKTYSNTHSKSNHRIQNKPALTDALSVLTVLDEASLTNLLQHDPNTAILTDDIHVQNPNNLILSPNTLNSTHINAPLSPGLDLLGGLQPEEAGLTEDLMMHVAQLVESSENLQEVIDKQVLGKVNQMKEYNTVTSNIVADIHHPIQPMQELKIENSVPPTPPSAVTPTTSSNEPIKIYRGNGRVITLPPIEAPATRSKRKSLLNTTVEPIAGDPSLNKLTTPASQSAAIKEAVQGNLKRTHRAGDQPSILTKLEGGTEIGDSDGSWNSEDDPDRLWCICKQPHNNRFMICCDMCEDWFHGKCVNVTKAMGQEMEEKGIEWRCPNCVRKTKQPSGKPSHKSAPRRSSETKSEEPQPQTPAESPETKPTGVNCIVCKKVARPNTIFCSDTCIQKHSQDALTSAKTTSGGEIAQKQKPDQRVVVIDKLSGKYLAGPSAPTAANLKSWLLEHPTFEVVRPANKPHPQQPQSTVKAKPKSDAPKVVQSIIKFTNDNQLSIGQPNTKSQVKPSPKTTTSSQPTTKIQPPKPVLVKPGLKSPPATKSQTPATAKPKPVVTPKSPSPQTKQSSKSPASQPSTSSKKEEHRRHSSSSSSSSSPAPLPIRESVRKGLEEHISSRMTETKENKLTPEEITKFSNHTEKELHELFKGVGAKYKAKYRSLLFNITDRKNVTLWKKICDKALTPKQLVRLSPEELASQELAQWRDKETKHQLELIKKSEMDLLACAKTYVLKTHKGEEVIESKVTDMMELDPNVSVEDLVSALNKSGVEGFIEEGKPSPASHHNKHLSLSKSLYRRDSSSSHDKKSSDRHSKDSKSSRSHHRKSSRERDKRDHKKHDDRKSSSSGSHRKSSSSSHKRTSSRDKSRTRSRSKDRSKHRDEERKTKPESIKEDAEINIDDKLLIDSNILVATINEAIKESTELLIANETERELANSVKAPIWKGSMSMIDVAKFSVSAYKISNFEDQIDLTVYLNPDIDIVGRISPEIVWDYLGKIKKHGNKDIQIVRLSPSISEDRLQFNIFYSYLESRNRLGVGRVGSDLKDFYIYPMTETAKIPEILSTLCGLKVEDAREDLLIGIIVRQKRKRPSIKTSFIPAKISKKSDPSEAPYTPPVHGSYTPPGSPKKSVLPPIPTPDFIPGISTNSKDKISSTFTGDENEPYSPGGSDNSDDLLSHTQGELPSVFVPTSNDDLQRKVDEINRKIEEQKKAIESMSSVLPVTDTMDEEPYSPSRPMTPPITDEHIPALSSISLPSNLQEILASIQKQTKPDSASQPEPYLPAPASSRLYSEASGDVDMRLMHPPPFIPTMPPPPSTYKSTGTLSSLSEEELLSMVPDNEIINNFPPPYKKSKKDYSQPPPHLAPPGTDE